MKSIRNIVNNNKGLFSLWLIFIFLNTGFVKNMASGITATSNVTETAHHDNGSKHDIAAMDYDSSDSSFFDQLKKGIDSDDLEFVSFGNFTSKPITCFQEQHQFAEISMRPETYRVALYDLYCNWKFHLA